jgi:hypothetical protein
MSYIVKRSLHANADTLQADHQFAVFGEDAREKPKNLRRRKR